MRELLSVIDHEPTHLNSIPNSVYWCKVQNQRSTEQDNIQKKGTLKDIYVFKLYAINYKEAKDSLDAKEQDGFEVVLGLVIYE